MVPLRALGLAALAAAALFTTGCNSRELEEKDIEIAELNRYIKELEGRSAVVVTTPGGTTGTIGEGLDLPPVKSTDVGDVFTLASDLFFASGSAVIKAGVRAQLANLAKELTTGKYKGKQIRIDGHTDSDPIRHSHWKSNQQLSEARGEAVKKFLAERGVSAGRMTVVGHADRKPLGSEKSKNRRVEVTAVR